MPDFRVGNIIKDARILDEAKTAAFSVVEKDPELARPENSILREVLRDRWKGRLELAGIG